MLFLKCGNRRENEKSGQLVHESISPNDGKRLPIVKSRGIDKDITYGEIFGLFFEK